MTTSQLAACKVIEEVLFLVILLSLRERDVEAIEETTAPCILLHLYTVAARKPSRCAQSLEGERKVCVRSWERVKNLYCIL